MVDLDSKLFLGFFVDGDGIKLHVLLAVAGVKEKSRGQRAIYRVLQRERRI